jgi:hypothetical protein
MDSAAPLALAPLTQLFPTTRRSIKGVVDADVTDERELISQT